MMYNKQSLSACYSVGDGEPGQSDRHHGRQVGAAMQYTLMNLQDQVSDVLITKLKMYFICKGRSMFAS